MTKLLSKAVRDNRLPVERIHLADYAKEDWSGDIYLREDMCLRFMRYWFEDLGNKRGDAVRASLAEEPGSHLDDLM